MKLWGSQVIQSTVEIDLREEFNRLIDGYGGTAGLGQFLILRHMSTEKCVCWDPVAGSANDCKYCKGETYKFEETFVRGYFTQTFGRSLSSMSSTHVLHEPGYFDQDKALIYLKFDAPAVAGDAIFRIRINTEGNPYYPTERIEKWRVTGVEDKRAEGGKLIYNICLCERTEV